MKLKDLPQEIRELVIERADFTALEIKEDDGLDSLFDWDDSPEGGDFWDSIDEGDFSPYYEKYGRGKQTNSNQKDSTMTEETNSMEKLANLIANAADYDMMVDFLANFCEAYKNAETEESKKENLNHIKSTAMLIITKARNEKKNEKNDNN